MKTLVDDFEKQNSSSIEHVNELIKIRSRFFGETTPEKFEQLAVKALSQEDLGAEFRLLTNREQ